MKKILTILLAVMIAASCSKEKTVTISGKITNPLDDNVVVQINYLDQSDTISLADDGTFATEIAVDRAYLGKIKNERMGLPVYLIPGKTIHVEIDADELKKRNASAVKISGDGGQPTELMYGLQKDRMKTNMKELLKMRVDSFEQFMDETMKSNTEAIEKFKTENSAYPKFVETISFMNKIDAANKYKTYIMYHNRYAPNDTLPIPESFQAYMDEIPVDDYEKCKEIPEYKYWILSYHQNKIKEQLAADKSINHRTVAYTEKNIDAIAALDIPWDIKNELGNSLISSYSYRPDSIQVIYKNRYKEIVQNEEYITQFEKIVATIEKLKPGSTAPGFNYPDIDGKMVSSTSLKGKVIYIDVWATWCGPCKAEIPHLKKMEVDLHNEPIAFVSISIDKDKQAWEKMVKEKELGGYQLFADRAWESSITTEYAIRGIPRFIMIDKEGKLVNANASRPSNPETKKKLLELAKS